MRGITFRGKRIDNGEWVEGNLVRNDNGKDYFIVFMGDDYLDYYWEIIVHPNTVGQYTGLTDKNGNRIFEGDIVRANNGHISQVVFWHGGFCLYCECHKNHSDFIPTDIIEVIGNIHDNSELMKGESE